MQTYKIKLNRARLESSTINSSELIYRSTVLLQHRTVYLNTYIFFSPREPRQRACSAEISVALANKVRTNYLPRLSRFVWPECAVSAGVFCARKLPRKTTQYLRISALRVPPGRGKKFRGDGKQARMTNAKPTPMRVDGTSILPRVTRRADCAGKRARERP